MARVFALVCAFAVLLQTGYCLTCSNCTIDKEGNCKVKYVSCKRNEVCVSVFVQVGTITVTWERKCAPKNLCNQSFSYIDGGKLQRIAASCCGTDKCTPSPPKSNDLSCKSCTVKGSSQCQATTDIQCAGREDKCFSYRSDNLFARGCTSSNLCNVDLQGTIVPDIFNKGKAECMEKGANDDDNNGGDDNGGDDNGGDDNGGDVNGGDDNGGAESSGSAIMPYSILSLAFSIIFVFHCT